VSAIRILIADDHPVYRRGLKALLQLEEGMTVIAEANDGEDAIRVAREVDADVMLLDLQMPHRNGLEVLQELGPAEGRRLRVVMLTAAIERWQIVEALRLGASGVVLKDAAVELLVKAIRKVAQGELWIGRGDLADIVASLRQPNPDGPARFGLTRRELDVVRAVVDGCSNRDVAKRLGISEDTVKHHMTSIFDKLGVSSRLELAIFASNWKLVDPA
jgi:two-component system, NarL family, nitrate/nitrite response regulator NarL